MARTLLLTSPHMRGGDVQSAQRLLKSVGYYGGEIDGDVEDLLGALGFAGDGKGFADSFVVEVGDCAGGDLDFCAGGEIGELGFGAFGSEAKFAGAEDGQENLLGLNFFAGGEMGGFDGVPGFLIEVAVNHDAVD